MAFDLLVRRGFTTPTEDGSGTITYDVYVDWKMISKLARKAAHNKSGKSNIGPMRVIVHKAKGDK